jgi:hypothetical protein
MIRLDILYAKACQPIFVYLNTHIINKNTSLHVDRP